MFQLFKILKTKNCISEASSGENTHLKKVQMGNVCVSVAYINETNLLQEHFNQQLQSYLYTIF
jgi:hypothetical protein